jgi:nucleoside-diphosphate-sugar epimerase
MTKQALVVGGLGVSGRGIVAALMQQPGWRVVTLSRRLPEQEPGVASHISVDLLDGSDVEAKLSRLTGITDLPASLMSSLRPTWSDQPGRRSCPQSRNAAERC